MRAGARGGPPVAPLCQRHAASVYLHLWLGFSVNSPLLGRRLEDPEVHHRASKPCATAQAPEGAALLVLVKKHEILPSMQDESLLHFSVSQEIPRCLREH